MTCCSVSQEGTGVAATTGLGGYLRGKENEKHQQKFNCTLNLFQDEESRYLGLCVSLGWGRNQAIHAEEMIKDKLMKELSLRE